MLTENDLAYLRAQNSERFRSRRARRHPEDVQSEMLKEHAVEQYADEGEEIRERIHRARLKIDENRAAAARDPDGFTEQYLEKLTAGKDREARCICLYRQMAGAEAAVEALQAGRRDWQAAFSEQEECSSFAGATEAEEDMLFHQAKQAMQNLAAAMESAAAEDLQAAILEGRGAEAKFLLSQQHRETLAMEVYLQAHSGRLENVPQDITPEQAAASVCYEMELLSMLESAGRNETAVTVVDMALFLLGLAVIPVTVTACGIAVAVTAAEIFGAVMSTLVAAAAAIAVIAFFLDFYENWDTVSREVAEKLTDGAAAVLRGLKKLLAHIRVRVLPAVQTAVQVGVRNLQYAAVDAKTSLKQKHTQKVQEVAYS